ncbi:MAG: arginine repressor [Butyricicoccus sp.]|uniref:arginine repressor n=1 Tax=Intestinibacillus sp. Marseille-P6563 TaxID=2364792 RepID=UPI000F04B161|nr:arginine repressor [Intestinibacillus sp. Marseille-P6563]MDR3767468.1 arginine repressor [Butyricicoccus sp.]
MKFQRQAKILDLIDQFEIETQEELSEHLRDLGYTTTQATVSRDIKELRLIKILSSTTGKYRYAVATSEVENSFTNRLRNIFKECVTEISYAQNMVVIKTLPGLGQAAAMAIDAMRDKRVIGTLGGDDTVFIVMRDESVASQFCSEAQKTLL